MVNMINKEHICSKVEQPHVYRHLNDLKLVTKNATQMLESMRLHIIRAYLNACNVNTFEGDVDGGACDFIAELSDHLYKIQLKSRPTVDQKYLGKDIYMMFPLDARDRMTDETYVIVPHDALWETVWGQWGLSVKDGTGYDKPVTTNEQRTDLIRMSIIEPVSPLSELLKLDYL